MRLCVHGVSSYILHYVHRHYPSYLNQMNLSFQNCLQGIDYHCYLQIVSCGKNIDPWNWRKKTNESDLLPRLTLIRSTVTTSTPTTTTSASSRLSMSVCCGKFGRMASMLRRIVQVLSIIYVQLLMESIRIRIIVLCIRWCVLELFMDYSTQWKPIIILVFYMGRIFVWYTHMIQYLVHYWNY